MKVLAVETVLLDLPLREPFVAGHGRTDHRRICVIRIETDVGPGWGECSALPEPTYTAEWSDGAFDVIVDRFAPLLVGRDLDTGSGLRLLAGIGGNPMAKAGIEMALLDARLRRDDRSLANHLGVDRATVPAGASVGLASTDQTAVRCRELVDEGFGRLKLKITPGHDLALVEAVRSALGPDAARVELQVDGNGGFDPDGSDAEALRALAALGIAAIEQPFPVDRPDAAARLIRSIRDDGFATTVVADEAVESQADLERLLAHRAVGGVSIKPPRVGGIASTLTLHRMCVEQGLTATAGGMLETGLGRRSLAAVAALPGFGLTGDLSPAGRWLAEDPWPDLTMVDGMIRVPTEPGVAPDPDPAVLDRRTVKRSTVRAGD